MVQVVEVEWDARTLEAAHGLPVNGLLHHLHQHNLVINATN